MGDIEILVLFSLLVISVISLAVRAKRKAEEERYMAIAFEAARSAEHAIRRAEAYSEHYAHLETRSKYQWRERAKAMQTKGKCLWCTTPYEDESGSCTKCGAPKEEVDVAAVCAESTRMSLLRAYQIAASGQPRFRNVHWRI